MNKRHLIWENEFLEILKSFDIRIKYISRERTYEFSPEIRKATSYPLDINIDIKWQYNNNYYSNQTSFSIQKISIQKVLKFGGGPYLKIEKVNKKVYIFNDNSGKYITKSEFTIRDFEKEINEFLKICGYTEKIRNKKIEQILD